MAAWLNLCLSAFYKKTRNGFGRNEVCKYAISKYIYKLIYILCIILTKLLMIDMICFGLSYFKMIAEDPYIVTTVLSIIIDAVLSIIIISFTLRRLREIISDHGPIIINYQKDITMDDDNIDYEHRPSMFQIFCRITILSTYCIISSKLYIILDAVHSFFFDGNIWLNALSACFLPIYCLINIMAIFLSFEYGNMWYHEFCKTMEKRCGTMFNKKIKKKQLIDLQQQLLEN